MRGPRIKKQNEEAADENDDAPETDRTPTHGTVADIDFFGDDDEDTLPTRYESASTADLRGANWAADGVRLK